MAWAVEELVGGPELDHAAEVHDRDPVGDLPDHREVVRDEDVREVELVLERPQQREDLRLHGHVERRHRLVADDQPRVEREGAGDADPLPLPAGELVRVAADVLRAQADDLEQLLHAGPDLRAARDPVDPERVADDLLDGLPRVQRRVGVLEDDLHLAAERTQLALGQLGDIPPSKRIVPPSGRAGGA